MCCLAVSVLFLGLGLLWHVLCVLFWLGCLYLRLWDLFKAFETFSKVKVLRLAQILFLEKHAPALQIYPHPTEETRWNAQVQHSKVQKRPWIPSHYIAGSVHATQDLIYVQEYMQSFCFGRICCEFCATLIFLMGALVTVWSLQSPWCFPRRLHELSIH